MIECVCVFLIELSLSSIAVRSCFPPDRQDVSGAPLCYCWVDPVVVDHRGNQGVNGTTLVAETTRKEPEGARSGVPKKELEKDK